MIAIIVILAIALAGVFQPKQPHRVIVVSVEIHEPQYQWIPMFNGWFEITKKGKGISLKSAPAHIGRRKKRPIAIHIALALIAVTLMTITGIPLLYFPLDTFTWNQTSGILASNEANWLTGKTATAATRINSADPDLVGATQFHHVSTRNSSGRYFAIMVQNTTRDLVVNYSDNDGGSWTRVVIDTSRNYVGELSIVVDSSDTVYVGANINSGNGDSFLWQSTDNGVTWSDTNFLINDENLDNGRGCEIVIDQDDFVHFVWQGAAGASQSNAKFYAISDRASPDTRVFQLSGNLRITHGSVTGGPFDQGEVVNFVPSGASGTTARVNSGTLDFISFTGTPADGDVLTGVTSGASATESGAAGDIPDDWDIESFKGAADGASETIDSGLTWSVDSWGTMSLCATQIIGHGSVTGSFSRGETVTGGTSGATGIVFTVRTSPLELSVIAVDGTFQNPETITTSGGSATTNASPVNQSGLLMVWDNATVDTVVYFRRKDDDDSWANAPARISMVTGIAETRRGSLITNANATVSGWIDDSVFVVGLEEDDEVMMLTSVDGGENWGSLNLIHAFNPNNSTITFDGEYFWHTTDGGTSVFFTRMHVPPSGVVTIVEGPTQIVGTVGGNSDSGPHFRWTRFHHHEIAKVDLHVRDQSALRPEYHLLIPGVPNIEDDVVFDGTSSTNCTWDIAPSGALDSRVLSFSMNTGYPGTVTGSVSLDVSVALAHNSGALQMDNGFTCTTFTTLFNSSTTTRARGSCTATTSLTVSGNTTFQLSATTGVTTLTCPSVSSLGTFNVQDNTVNEVIMQGPDNTTAQNWSSGAPDLDVSGSGSLVLWGTTSTNRGLTINAATFTIGIGSLAIRNQSEFDSLTFSTATLEILGSNLVIINDNWDSSSGTFTSNTSLVRFTGAADGSYSISTSGLIAQTFHIVEWAANSTTGTVNNDIFIKDFIDFTGDGDIIGTQDVVLTSLTQATPYRNSSSSNDMTGWTGEVRYDFSASAVDTFLQGFYPTLRVVANDVTNFDISGTLTAEEDIIFGGGGGPTTSFRHNSGNITCVNWTVRNDSDFTHNTAADLQILASGTLSVFGRFFATSTTNSYTITATDIVVTQVISDGVFNFTDVNGNGSSINLGSTVNSGLVAGAATEIVIRGENAGNIMTFTGFISCTTPDIFELEFLFIDTNDGSSTGLTINGDNSAASSFFVRDCDIDSPFLGWSFGGTAWSNTDVAQFLRNDVEVGVRITNDAKIGMTNSVIPDAGMDTANGSLIVFGTVVVGNLIADIFGSFDVPGDILASQSVEAGQKDVVNIREPIFVGVTVITVTADQNINSWIMDATDTSGTVNGSFTLTTNLTSQLSTLEILGIYHHNNSGALDIVGVNSVVRANSGGTFRISTQCLVTMDDTTVLRVSNDSFIDITGIGRASRVNFARNITAGNEPFIHIEEAETAGSGGINMQFVGIVDFGAGNTAALHIQQNSAGVIDDIIFNNCSSAAIDISGATGTGAGQPGIQITTMSITNCGVGVQALFTGPANARNVVRDVTIDGCSIGVSFGGQSWEGTMHNLSSINNSTYGLQVAGSGSQFDNEPASINHCVFHGDTADINMVAGALDPKLAMTNCILSDKATSAQVSPGGTTWQVISYNHNRANTKEVIVFNDLVIDSDTTTPIHCDKFDWSEFNLAADGASYVVPTPATTPISELIPVESDRSYFISFTGTLSTFDTVETLSVGGSSTTATGLSSGAIHTIGANRVFLQISWGGAVAGETLTHLEIREDNSAGDLIYNEDLINKFKSPNSGWEYSTGFGLAGTSGSAAILPFGDFGYEFIEMIIELPIIPSGDRAGVVLGWQNATNYYEVYLDGTNNDVRINKVISGVPTLIDSAATFNGSSGITPNSTAYTMRVTWNKAANNAIEVNLDNGVVEDTVDSDGWVNETTNAFVTDAQFDVGNVGLISEDVLLDNLKVNHDGFYIREANLTLATGVSITVQNGGVFDTNEVTVNASQSVLNVQAGGTNNQVATTWLDENFDENVLGPQTLECGNTLEVTGDIVWGVAGEADWTGITIVHATPTSTYRIITDAALTALPITARAISLPNVQPSIRPLDGSEGRYDLDPTKPSPSELILRSPDPVHRRETLQTPVWGADRARVTPWTMDSKRFTLRFFSKRDKCLWGKCEKWKDNATPLEVVYYRGIVWGVIITDVRALRVRNNKSIHEWEVDFIEAR